MSWWKEKSENSLVRLFEVKEDLGLKFKLGKDLKGKTVFSRVQDA
jgi:hypothetical protein